MGRFKDSNSTGRGYHIISGDLRHWFHQIPMSSRIQGYFGLALHEARCYVWRSLPMGWSYSPLIAQTTAWMALTHYEVGEFDYFKWKPSQENGPPTYVEILHRNGSSLGWATIYYDNYIMVVKDLSVAEALNTRIIRNCKKFNIAIEEHFFQSRNSLLSEPCRTLGLEVKFVHGAAGNRKRPRDEVFELHWRLSPRGEHAPCQRKDKDEVFTPREIAATIGRVLYARMIEGPLGRRATTRAALRILSRISKTAWKMSWDYRGVSLSTGERQDLEDEWTHVELNPWRCQQEQRNATTELFVATDACNEGWAFVVLDSGGQVLQSSGFIAFDDQLRGRHIYIKELFAAIQGIRVCQKDSTARVYVITDNTACAWGFKKGVLLKRRSYEHDVAGGFG